MDRPGELSVCKWCRAHVRWVRTARTLARMPLDADPSVDGNVWIDARGMAHVVARGRRVPDAYQGWLWRPHFASCTGARRHGDTQRARQRTLDRLQRGG